MDMQTQGLTQDELDEIRASGEGMIARREDDHPDNTEPIASRWGGEPSDVTAHREKAKNDVRVLAIEVLRINAEGGTRGKDETARWLYETAYGSGRWTALTLNADLGLHSEQQKVAVWRGVGRVVDESVDRLFPSAEAVRAAENILANAQHVEGIMAGREVPDSLVQAVTGRLPEGTRVRSLKSPYRDMFGEIVGFDEDLGLPLVRWVGSVDTGTEAVERDEYEVIR